MWSKEVSLPFAGLTVPIYNESATASPMGRGGVRVKWRRHGERREVRLGAEIAFGDAHIRDKIEALAAEFGGEVVATTGLDDTDAVAFSTHVIRERDLRRHVVVVVRNVDDHRVVQGSIECTGADPSELRDEWAALEQLMTRTVDGAMGSADDPITITFLNPAIGLAFDLPGGVYSDDVAYGMEQLRRSRSEAVGRVVYGGLAAHGAKRCLAAVHELVADPGVTDAEVWVDDDLAWLRGGVSDSMGHEGELVVAVRAVGRIALAIGALVLPGETSEPVLAVMREAAGSARTFRRQGHGRPPRHLADVVSKIDTFRMRVDDAGHRVAGG